MKCSFCPDSGRKPDFMSEALFSEILDQIKGSSDYIYFHVKGEPLLHPHLDRFLDISKEKKFRVSLATNGTLIEKSGPMLLQKPALRQISFSLHSLEGRKDPAYIENYLDNIFSFALEAARKTSVFVEFKLWNLNRGNDGINAVIFDHIEKRLNVPRVQLEEIGTGKGKRILNRIYLSRGSEFLWPDIESPDNSRSGYCYGLKKQAAILVDGTVVPCCLDGKGVMNLGNVRESSFAEIIDGERALRIIRGFSQRLAVEPVCIKCTYRNRFGL